MKLIALVLGLAALSVFASGGRGHGAASPPSFSELPRKCSQLQRSNRFALSELLFLDFTTAQKIARRHGQSLLSSYYDPGFAGEIIQLVSVENRIDVQTSGGYVIQFCGNG
jgi:hypothetical protein